jgi:hypothetical protein
VVEILSEMYPISDDRRKFAMGSMRYPAKRAPELEETLEAVEGSTLKETRLMELQTSQ